MTWVLIAVASWLAVSVIAALLIGRTVHAADVIEHTGEAAVVPVVSPDVAGVSPPEVGSVLVPVPREAVGQR